MVLIGVLSIRTVQACSIKADNWRTPSGCKVKIGVMLGLQKVTSDVFIPIELDQIIIAKLKYIIQSKISIY